MLATASHLLIWLSSASALVGGSPLLSSRQDTGATPDGGNSSLPILPVRRAAAMWDGELFYPQPIDGFEASKYVGPRPDGDSRSIWYQWAASDQPFLSGCRCMYARYGTNENGTISVENSCTRGNRTGSITGYAAPTPDYGNGTFNVTFFGAEPQQPGPNYVVTRAFVNKPGDDKERADDEADNDDDGEEQQGKEDAYETVVVGSQNFTGWFLLSRTREVEWEAVENYLLEVADAGFNLRRAYQIYDQSDCGEAPRYDASA